jgi:hypothetical protein
MPHRQGQRQGAVLCEYNEENDAAAHSRAPKTRKHRDCSQCLPVQVLPFTVCCACARRPWKQGALTISAGFASSRCRGSRPFRIPLRYPEGWSVALPSKNYRSFMAASVRRSRSRIAFDRPRWTFPTRSRTAACAAIRPLSRGPQVMLSDFAPLSGREPLSA